MEKKHQPKSVEEYIASFPEVVQKKLILMRELIRKSAPEAEERLSYNMPAFFLNGALLWYAAHAKHIGLYPKAKAIVTFKKELVRFKTARGSIQFPMDKPLPRQLIKQIVKYRVIENARRPKRKSS